MTDIKHIRDVYTALIPPDDHYPMESGLVLSTGHIPKDELAALSQMTEPTIADIVAIFQYEYGTLFMLSPTYGGREQADYSEWDGTPTLLHIILTCSTMGYRYVRFDSDADPCDLFPTFDHT